MIDCTSKCNKILFQRILLRPLSIKKQVKDLTLTFPIWVLGTAAAADIDLEYLFCQQKCFSQQKGRECSGT